MSSLNIAVYAGGPLGPVQISQNLAATQAAGWTTIILSLYHIGRPEVTGQHYGDIIFNDTPVIEQGSVLTPGSWADNIALLKTGSNTITRIYASIGGGAPVEDYQTIKKIYDDNGNSFSGTALESNFQLFRTTFPAIDGIDMDVEDTYDPDSFLAFCDLLIGMGFDITFVPYTLESFWTAALAKLHAAHPGSVKWWNLQMYSGGTGNNPQNWADQIASAIPGFDTDRYILASSDTGGGPSGAKSLLQSVASEPAVGGGFIWNLDGIANGGYSQADFVNAIQEALSGS